MDITTIAGILSAIVLFVLSVFSGQITGAFINMHGLFLVLGGTIVALLINTPLEYLWNSGKAVKTLFFGHRYHPKEVVPVLVATSKNVHARGVGALSMISPKAGGGFVKRAAQVALEFKNPDYVSEVLEHEINQWMDRKTEVVNVFRTMGVLAPMFGLLGTLIGIIDVLKHISEPEQVGSSMATAVTTAFYGILLANLIAVPIAGKLRIRFWEEFMMRRVVAEGIVQMLKGVVPAVLERRLEAYLSTN